MTCSRTRSIMAEKNYNLPIYCDFSHFTSIIWPCGRDNMESFSCILPKFDMHVRLLMTVLGQVLIMAGKNSKWPIYCNFSHFTLIIWPCERDNLKSFSCILFNFVRHVTNKHFSDKFDNGWKKAKWSIYCNFSHFTSIIWPCWRDNMKSFWCILPKCVMHVTNHVTDQFSDNFNNGWKKIKMADFTSIIWPCGRNNFNNGGRLLSSVLLFHRIF